MPTKPRSQNAQLLKWVAIGLLTLSLALLFYASFDTLKGLAKKWGWEEYSHGPLIVFVAFILGWHKLVENKPKIAPSWWGAGGMLAAAALMVIGRLSAFEPPAFYGVLLALVALSLGFFGKKTTRALSPAFVYLIFAVPLPSLIYFGMSQKLQLLSSYLGVLPLHFAGIPVYQEGNVIDLGTMKLQVVEACNGLRYLFPLMSFGYLVAYLMQDRLWKRAVVFFSTIPITIGMNSLRIAAIGLTVNLWGEKMAEGLIHDFEGWTVFILCLAVLLAEVWVLSFIGPRGRFAFEYVGLPGGKPFAEEPRPSWPAAAVFAICGLMALTLGRGLVDARPENTPPHTPFATFPLRFGEWEGRLGRFEPRVLNTLRLTDYWVADYARPQDKISVNFYMAYYASQRMGSTIHLPQNCIATSGWLIRSREAVEIPVAGGEAVKLSRMLISRANETQERQLVYYWFDQRGRALTDQYIIKWYLLWDSITMGRTDGTMIRLTTPLGQGEPETAGDERLRAFLAAAYGDVKKYLEPGKPAP